MDQNRLTRRSFLAVAAAAPVGMSALASCGTSGPGQAAADEASVWYLSGQPQEGLRQSVVDAFNASSTTGKVAATFYENDAYKTKIKGAVGANQAPTMIWTWGGGGLKDYVKNGQVDDLTSFFNENPDAKSKRFASAFPAATVDGKIYAVPCEQVAPIVLFYNKALFEQVGAQPPTTWGEMMALIPVFNNAGVAPMSLAGQSRWTNMMWLEYLFDRTAGPEVFESIAAGEKDGWSHPGAIASLTKMQDFIKAGGFVKGFESIAADQNADQALLHQGKAAMMLHGAWTFGSMNEEGGDFVSSGKLGYTTFPAVEGGAGDPSNTVGNPASFLALSSKASDQQKAIAKEYFLKGLLTDADVNAWIQSGSVPIVNGADAKFAGQPNAEWMQYVYDMATKAKYFGHSWDQALPGAQADVLLTNIEQLFTLSITPDQFASNMNAAPAS